MSQYPSSNAARALVIPELLDMVFQYLDDASNASNARVCKQWSELALDTLWKEVTEPYHLFSLLAPMTCSAGEYSFTRPLESNDWRRFDRYRRRVRTLYYHTSEAEYILHPSTFDDLARTRTSFDILPCLHTLKWHARIALCVLFMHRHIRTFAVMLPSSSSLGSLFDQVAARMPAITHLDLRMSLSMRAIEPHTTTLLASLTKLTKITLPRFCLTTALAEHLSRLPHLESIEFQYLDEQGRGDPADVLDFSPVLTQGAFPALSDLNTTITYTHAARFFTASFAPTALTSLYLDSTLIESPTATRALTTVLAESCQLLKSLALVSLVDASTVLSTPPDPDTCLAIADLRPLFRCTRLTSLEVVHHAPLRLSLADVEELARAWPAIETLLLNTEPAYLASAHLTLHALVPFARHCPSLRVLGLFLDASAPATAVADELPPFAALRRLSMGVSPLAPRSTGAAALFLSHLVPRRCPPACRIESGVTWDEALPVAPGNVVEIQARCEAWARVVELLPLLVGLRGEERERRRGLEEEVRVLRGRVGGAGGGGVAEGRGGEAGAEGRGGEAEAQGKGRGWVRAWAWARWRGLS
ncbi:hypothetical protein H0H81_000512 [Sphagnurus paluster]|uniref:F-box domain-containing protein n=1 Tax=Sphagnurus paluster TaxID=117069 RepID=A0A9P7GNG3_9AGAR|nr:hypothetical protein H0H81_000512 [Sphagnurus paluster]